MIIFVDHRGNVNIRIWISVEPKIRLLIKNSIFYTKPHRANSSGSERPTDNEVTESVNKTTETARNELISMYSLVKTNQARHFPFPKRPIDKNPKQRPVQPKWFHSYPWIHYSEAMDAAFCLREMKRFNDILHIFTWYIYMTYYQKARAGKIRRTLRSFACCPPKVASRRTK